MQPPYSVRVVPPDDGRGWSVLATRGRGSDRRRRRYGRDAGITDQASAWQAVALIERALEEGRWWEPSIHGALRAADLTLQMAAQGFIDSQARRGRNPRSLDLYAVHVHAFGVWLRDQTGYRTLEAFATLHARYGEDALYEFAAWLRRAPPGGAGLAESTTKGRVSMAARWWAFCARRWRAVVPPAPEVSITLTPKRIVAPTWEQMDDVLAAADSEPLRRLLWLLRCLGLRIRQAMALRWADFDLDEATLEVRPELGKTRAERTGRLVPVAPVLVREMAGWGTRDGVIVGWTCPNYHALRRAIRLAEVPKRIWARRPAHMFRAGFETGLYALGADRWAVERLTGHAIAHGESAVSATYVDDRQLITVLRAAVALVPPVGADGNMFTRRRAGAG